MKHTSLDSLIDELFNRSISDVIGTDATFQTPSSNVIETESDYLIKVAAPGLLKEDFEITTDKDQLILKVSKKEQASEKDKTFTRREFNFSNFTRRFYIPKDADKEEITASYNLGILDINIAKVKKNKEDGRKTIHID